jgi:hypothetical protein
MNSSSSSIINETGKSILAVANTNMLADVRQLVFDTERKSLELHIKILFIGKVGDLLDELAADSKCVYAVCDVVASWTSFSSSSSSSFSSSQTNWLQVTFDILITGLLAKCIKQKTLNTNVKNQIDPLRKIAETIITVIRHFFSRRKDAAVLTDLFVEAFVTPAIISTLIQAKKSHPNHEHILNVIRECASNPQMRDRAIQIVKTFFSLEQQAEFFFECIFDSNVGSEQTHFAFDQFQSAIKNSPLLNSARPSENSPLMIAIDRTSQRDGNIGRKADTNLVKKFIAAGANVNEVCEKLSPNMKQRYNVVTSTPLIFAIQTRNIEVVKLLLAEGANVNQLVKTEEEEVVGSTRRKKTVAKTPLMVAICDDVGEEICRLLLEAGADVNGRIDDPEHPGRKFIPGGKTPLMHAVSWLDGSDSIFPVLRLLLNEYNADYKLVDDDGHDVLFHAVRWDLSKKCVKFFFKLDREHFSKSITTNHLVELFDAGSDDSVVYFLEKQQEFDCEILKEKIFLPVQKKLLATFEKKKADESEEDSDEDLDIEERESKQRKSNDMFKRSTQLYLALNVYFQQRGCHFVDRRRQRDE